MMSAPQTERLEFPGARGERLAARLERPSGQTDCFALFAHCFTCSKDLKAIKRQLLDDLAEHSVQDAIADLRRPLLLFHSPLDNVVAVDHARRIFEAAKHPKSFISLDNADHLLLGREDVSQYVAHVLATWAERYVGRKPAAPVELPSPEPGQVVVIGQRSGMLQQVIAGRHRMIADEPEEHGGSDAGPNPYELLLAGLGSCTAMTLRMYADRKQWSLGQVRVYLNHTKVHANDCEGCETKAGKIDRIERVLEFEGDLSDQQRERLVEIADRCPVSRTLDTETKIETRHRRAARREPAGDPANGPA